MGEITAILRSFLILSVVYPVLVWADCRINFISQEGTPLIVQSFGSRKIIQRNPSALELKENEEIEAFCSSELIVRIDCCQNLRKIPNANNSAVFQCISDRLHFDAYTYSGEYNTLILGCSSSSLKLYESNTSLPNCPYMSYGIGMEWSGENVKRTGLCFDLDTLSVKYVKYLTHSLDNKPLPTKNSAMDHDVISLDIELKRLSSIFSFMSDHVFFQKYRGKQSENILLENQNFDFENLVGEFLNNEYSKFEEMFRVIWWRNLRTGNWKFFMNALKERSENVTYMAYTGVSGTLDMPSMQSCKKANKFEIRTNELTVKAPAYIYTYLQSLRPSVEEDLVVIGYNSPFYTPDKKNEFCVDMCDQIDWLDRSIFGKTHLMPVFGAMTCCRVGDVFNKLDNFPYVNVSGPAGTTQAPIETR